ncbi:PREDICTED: putative uncharacterized protein DDB_G0289963 [Eufriesea mexicana]|uniref:putative uncharacterized protein DDB_G0289963 n=1 Tax=Eufriesea mexicana TaxID=516756 RepID=UPI00083BE4EA|nr:PREDICTED: putative uncharacterized protein DDB_G0289963 [Eufriesea mexicana]
MESDEITWKVVPNTVTNRMVDHSLIHKLIPSRRLRRRNKVMNVAIKQSCSLKTYSQYIKMKTSVLRNLSDDDETDNNDNFTEDDFNILYKSNLFLTSYIQHMSNKSKTYSYEADFLINEDDMSNEEITKILKGKHKDKSLKNIHLSCQKGVKRKAKDTPSSTKETNVMTSLMNNNQGTIQEETVNACALIQSSSEITYNKIAEQVVTNANNESGQPNPMVNKTDEKIVSNKNYSYEMFSNSNKEISKGIQDSLISPVDNVNDSCINTEMLLNQNCSNQVEKNSNMENTFMDKSSLITVRTYQPKDSGIEEDTDEEFLLENGRRHYKKLKKKSQKIKQNMSNTSLMVKHADNLTNYDDTLKSENYNIPTKSDATDETLCLNENIIINNEKCNDKILKHKLQPKVTHTEIVDKKYKIVPGTSVFNKNVEEERSSIKDFSDRKHETDEAKQNIEDNTCPLARKRLQQLRRLNLTVDSDSSLSENDDTYCNIENMRDKLFKRPKESLDILNTEDENVKFKQKISIQCDKKLQKNENFSEETARCLNNEFNDAKQCSKMKDSSLDIKRLSFASHGVVQHKSSCLNTATSYNLKQKKHMQGSNKENLKIKCIIEATNKESVICGRPYNLQELIKKENLMLKTALPSFTLENIEENELFIIDVPSAVLENQLLGNKIHLTEKTLKLGKQKYRVKCKDINNISCVFASEKSHKPYKIVNIKPVIKVVTRENITQKSLKKSSNQCTNHNIDCTYNTERIEDEIVPTDFLTERTLIPKKKRRSISE